MRDQTHEKPWMHRTQPILPEKLTKMIADDKARIDRIVVPDGYLHSSGNWKQTTDAIVNHYQQQQTKGIHPLGKAYGEREKLMFRSRNTMLLCNA
ncbi:AAEL009819-PA [Aedes aegypti]|uniref:AAEL009819-PA n=1 Tax=Aedes aegypti TaxID=7159 RepID=Q16UQ8_AEDAE|nr:AAEL009819-PA [Aedes aegypti]